MATVKQQQNRKKFTKEYKVKEIQKNLTKKARLRKGYLKALKEEGYTVPEKKSSSTKRESLEKSSAKEKFDEKKQIKKQRQKLQREQLEARRVNESEKIIEAKKRVQQREMRKIKMTKKTRTGQPLMGPKIEDLLSRIKEDETYTK